ncbi:MAG: hypothetical protein ACM3PV_03885 [Betaproteobacteria bacterium]
MRSRALVVLTLAAVAAAPARAEKIPPDLRSAFEARIHKGCYAVVVQKGVPTTSIYGTKGDQTNAYYSVDVKGGEWQTSEGWLDLNQVAVDSLAQGEVMEVVDVTFKDARIDLRMASLEAHKVTRGTGFAKSTKREPVSTNFKFFFPFTPRSAQDLPQVLAYVEPWLRVFPSEPAARAAAAHLIARGEPAADRAAAPARGAAPARAAAAAPAATTRKEIKAGMSMLEVIDLLGKPQKEVSFETRTRWTYPDLTVVFVNGRVKEVQF